METMSELYDIDELLEVIFPIKFDIIEPWSTEITYNQGLEYIAHEFQKSLFPGGIWIKR